VKFINLLKNQVLTNVVFHGFYPNPIEILLRTGVFISIQIRIIIPPKVYRAMACGNAIIATDVGTRACSYSMKRMEPLSFPEFNACVK